jgi:mannan endo-1,4-beta-mannosidase
LRPTKFSVSIAVAIIIPALLLFGSLFLISGQQASNTPAVAPVPTPPPPPKVSGFLVGVREHGTPGPWVKITRFAAATRITPRLVLYYSGWYEPFQTSFAKTAARNGAEVLVQIQPFGVPLARIAAGHYDGYLRSYARQVAAFGRPVVIGFAHEMNGGWYPWGYTHTPAPEFVAAWRHIVTVFRRQGAANVRWLWTVSSGVTTPLRQFWPGSRYVTWVGIDGYYYLPGQHFGFVFGRTIREIHGWTKAPILLSEAAIGQKTGQARAMPDLFAGIRRHHLLGIVWFDVRQSGGKLVEQNWRLEGHAAAVAAFRRGVQSLGVPLTAEEAEA